jgi:hypothetical protein
MTAGIGTLAPERAPAAHLRRMSSVKTASEFPRPERGGTVAFPEASARIIISERLEEH